MKVQHLFAATLLVLTAGSAASAQTTPGSNQAAPAPKVIAVINRASWCPVCLLHGKRAMALASSYQGKAVTFLPNDLTNKTTKAASQQDLAKLGVAEAVAPYNSTGVMLLVDAQTHRVVQEISIAKATPILTQALDKALATH